MNEITEKYIKINNSNGRHITSYARAELRRFAQFLLQQNKLSVNSFNEEKTSGNKVAIITEDVGHLTGGRYYTWFITVALVEIGYDVTVYTNLKPIFHDSFAKYKQPKIEVIADRAKRLEEVDIQADIYIGSPISGNIGASRLGKKYKKPSYAIIFDPFPMMSKYLGSKFYKGWELLIKTLRENNTKIISLCNETSKYIYSWLDKRKDQVIPIYPCINSQVIQEVEISDKKENYVVFISRLVRHKKIEHVLEAVKNSDTRLKIISSVDGINVRKLIKEYNMQDKVDFHFKASDKEKFEIISKSRGAINGAIFEGFGMWACEAIAYGVPVICYDFPTLKEIQQFAGVNNFYFAKWNNPKSLTKQLQKCLKENKFEKPNNSFNFDTMLNKIKKVFDYIPKIGVISIVLNEEQYIGASLRSIIKHDNISKVAVVEGAVNLFAHASTKQGLSKDNTSKEILKVMNEKNGEKIIYDRYGWALDKSELRNHALSMLRNVDYILVVDGDEVWKQEDLDKIVKTIYENSNIGVFRFNFYHFWKKPNQITIGSQWNSRLFRFFKYADKSLHWDKHELPVVNSEGEQIDKTNGEVVLNDVFVYHYGAMKDEKRIIEKLEYYKKRDKNLVVKNTWSDWKKGKDTQWTHGGGEVVEFKGEHPQEVKGLI